MITSNFADSKILDIVRASYDFKTFCSSRHKSKGHRTAVSSEILCVHFSVQKNIGRRPAGHLMATGRISNGDWTATGRQPNGARSNTCRTSCRCHLRSTIRSTIRSRRSFQWNRWEFLIMPPRGKGKKPPMEAASPLFSTKFERV